MPGRVVPVAGRIVVAMTVRAPSCQPEDGFGSALTAAQSLALREALLGDSLDVLRRIRNVAPVVVYEPPESRAEIRRLVPPSIAVIGQATNAPHDPLTGACHGFLAMGARGIVFISADTPDLPAPRIRQAVEYLTEVPQRVVVGPSDHGGVYLLGVGASNCDLLRRFRWGTADVAAQAAAAADAMGLPLVELASWAEVHAIADVKRLVTRRTRAARRTRAWMRALSRPEANGPSTVTDAPTAARHGALDA